MVEVDVSLGVLAYDARTAPIATTQVPAATHHSAVRSPEVTRTPAADPAPMPALNRANCSVNARPWDGSGTRPAISVAYAGSVTDQPNPTAATAHPSSSGCSPVATRTSPPTVVARPAVMTRWPRNRSARAPLSQLPGKLASASSDVMAVAVTRGTPFTECSRISRYGWVSPIPTADTTSPNRSSRSATGSRNACRVSYIVCS